MTMSSKGYVIQYLSVIRDALAVEDNPEQIYLLRLCEKEALKYLGMEELIMTMNKVRESFEATFFMHGELVLGANYKERLNNWLSNFDNMEVMTPRGPVKLDDLAAHSVVLNCDGPDKGKDTRTQWQKVVDDVQYAHSSRLVKLGERVEALEEYIRVHFEK